MSATAPPASPSVMRSASTAHRSDRPHRTTSTANRPTPAQVPPASPHRSQSHSHSHSHSQSGGHSRTSSQQGVLANVARRDFEQSNVARPPPTSRPSESRDRTHAPPPVARTDSVRSSNHRSGSRTGHSRQTSDNTTMATNGMSGDHGRTIPGSSGSTARRRTTITAQTGNWALGKTIGQGSMGKVKLARNVDTGEQVAVKIVPRQSTDEHRSAADRERAEASKEIRTAREAAIVTLVNHPYICGMRDVVRTNYHWYMLFEYVNGGQMLDYIISHGRLKEKQARKFGRQIASALDYCHRNSIVHRDLKIENILISKTGDIKIIDFGLSNLFSPRSHLKTFCGSLYFAAPELLQARQYTGPEVDVWSFGIVLYVLVCGKVPFDDQSMPQLHAKIKKGVVEYPPWLSAECKNLISRMLVTDPKQRAPLTEIMNHPWMTKGFNTPPENYLPHREPLQFPLDQQIIQKMTGFDFGTPEYINAQLTKIIESDEYQHSVRVAARRNVAQTPEVERKRGVFDFYKRRNSTTSRETLTNPSSEAVPAGADPLNAYNPLISVYYLVKEKQDREKQESNPGALEMPKLAGEKPLPIPDLSPPPAAYTNPATYEMAGEAPTGGRTRPRARTHGEDEVTEDMKKMNLSPQPQGSPAILTPPAEQPPPKKESTAAGLLRRFSTRRHKDPSGDRSPAPPSVNITKPEETSSVLRKSFSVRRNRDKTAPPPSFLQTTGSTPHQPALLTPPPPESSASRRLMGLGRSTSVNSGDFRRRFTRRGVSEESTSQLPPTSGSDRSGVSGEKSPQPETPAEEPAVTPKSAPPANRTKSLGHARRESIQARRARRTEAHEANVPEETDQDLTEGAEGIEGVGGSNSPENMKPVYLKGLFSVSTTSSKPLPVIRTDIIRVLKQLGVEYHEIKGGFSCRHAPSINLSEKQDPASPGPPATQPTPQPSRRKISFGGFMGGDRDREEFRKQHNAPQTPSRSAVPDRSFTNSDDSDEGADAVGTPRPEGSRQRAAGETSTHVQTDMGESMTLRFEILLVKVPLLSLHGIQFKKVDGGTWQYKNMAQTILNELRL